MLYLAPIKYYDKDNHLKFGEILEDVALGKLDFNDLSRIENNLRLLNPKEYKHIIKVLWTKR